MKMPMPKLTVPSTISPAANEALPARLSGGRRAEDDAGCSVAARAADMPAPVVPSAQASRAQSDVAGRGSSRHVSGRRQCPRLPRRRTAVVDHVLEQLLAGARGVLADRLRRADLLRDARPDHRLE